MHTEYSLLKGACKLKCLIENVKKIGQKAIAITDFVNLFGAVKFFNECVHNDVKPIIGCELLISDDEGVSFSKCSEFADVHSIIVLCVNKVGYENLVKLVSFSNISVADEFVAITPAFLKNHSSGLIALSGGLNSEVAHVFFDSGYNFAKSVAKKYCNIFGKNNFFLELQNHSLFQEKQLNECLIKLSKDLNLNLVVTNNVHYVKKSDFIIQKILNCIKFSKTLNDKTLKQLPNSEFFLKTEEDIKKLFLNLDQAVQNSVKIANRCHFKFEFEQVKVPKFNFNSLEVNKKLLFEEAKKGLSEKYGEKPDLLVTKRFFYELDVVIKMNFVDYFLIVYDYVNYAKKKGIKVGPGRGSAAGSLLAFCLNITSIDPMEYDLSFDRFLNFNRKKMPDFDVDFCNERRNEVIDYVIKKYGSDRVARVVTFGTLAARAAVRDVARVFGVNLQVADRIAKLVPVKFKSSLKNAINESVQLRNLIDSDEIAREVLEKACLVEGLLKNTSMHAAALILSSKKLDSYVPLLKHQNIILTQYAMDDVTQLGFLKMDFLGLRNLTLIGNCEKAIKKIIPDFDVGKINKFDEKTFKLLSNGDSIGIFQLESNLTREILSRIKPCKISDLMIVMSLNRPGPSQFIETFIKNRRNSKISVHLNEKMNSILKSTYGVIVYQEQVMKIFREVAGYSFGRTDLVRKAITEKNFTLIEKERDIFLFGFKNNNDEVESIGAVNLGVDKLVAEQIFDKLTKFSAYAFNKSHAAAYSLIAYTAAYLKANFTQYYMISLLNSVVFNGVGNTKLNFYLNECNRLKIKVLNVNVNLSGVKFEILKSGSIIFPFSAVKGVGKALAEQIVIERNKKGQFNSIQDFINRMAVRNLNKIAFSSLLQKGAFSDFLDEHFNEKDVLKFKNELSKFNFAKQEINGQISLFNVVKNHQICEAKICEAKKNLSEFEIVAEVISVKQILNESSEIKFLSLTLLSCFKIFNCLIKNDFFLNLNFKLTLNDFFIFRCSKFKIKNKNLIFVNEVNCLSKMSGLNWNLVIKLENLYKNQNFLVNLIDFLNKNLGESSVFFVFNNFKGLFKKKEVPKVKLSLQMLLKLKNLVGAKSFAVVKNGFKFNYNV